VFLACPPREPVGAQLFPYQMSLDRFGSILNLFSSHDRVRERVADLTPALAATGAAHVVRQPAPRVEIERAARTAYADFEIATEDIGTDAHTAMHGSRVGYLVGRWLAGADFNAMLAQIGRRLFPVPKGDHG
jgi:hypothetical protein